MFLKYFTLALALLIQHGFAVSLPFKYNLNDRRGFCKHSGIEHAPEIEVVKPIALPKINNPIESEVKSNLFFSPRMNLLEHSLMKKEVEKPSFWKYFCSYNGRKNCVEKGRETTSHFGNKFDGP